MHRRRALARFFRTPKGLLTIVLALLTAAAAPVSGVRLLLPGVLAAVAAGAIVDLIILRIRNGQWEFPSGAVLTGLIIAMVLRPQEPWYVGAAR
jgi:Na+-translocating ferredoxin:NAD+ oxidoreductase RnfD subunit